MNISTFIMYFLCSLVFVLFIVIILLIKKKNNLLNENKNLKLRIQKEHQEIHFLLPLYKKLIINSSALDELSQYYHMCLTHANTDQIKNGPRIVANFLYALRVHLDIREIGPYLGIVLYDKRLHRCVNSISSDERVRIITPGWMYKSQIIKLAEVERIGR